MKHIIQFLVAMLFTLIFSSTCTAMENLFYILRSNSPAQISSAQDSMDSLTSHYNSINILLSQAYQVDANGMVWGFIDADVLKFAKAHSMKIMALVTNAGFNKIKVHTFLTDDAAQTRALNSLLEICDQQHFYGIQLDFEMVPLTDKEALTKFYQKAAALFHKKGYVVSFAVAPLINDYTASDFQKRIYENWEGAYDLKLLGECADFVTLMAYNQHAGKTTPGSTASINWVKEVIQYALRYIPANKISLGIPVYSGFWTTSINEDDPLRKVEAHGVGISYKKVNYLLKKHNVNLNWDDKEKINYTFYVNNWVNEYIFVEDEKSFKSKIDLVKKYNLRGISVFYIGIEDPKIWKVL